MKKRMIAVSLVLTTCFVGIALAAVPGQTARPLVCRDGSNAEITVNGDGVTIVTFPALPQGILEVTRSCGAVANIGVSSGALVGDYTEAPIVALKFEFKTDGHVPATFMPILKSGTRTWDCESLDAPTGSDWTAYSVGFDRAADNWTDTFRRGTSAEQMDAAWTASLEDVDSIGISLQAELDALGAQTFMIRNFTIVDANGNEYRTILTPLADALWARFRKERIADVSNTDDTDKDGVSDLDEVLAGTDADDGADKFIAKVVELVDTGDESGVRIQWESAVEWGVYTVYRSTDIAEGLEVVPGGEALTLADVDAVGNTSTWLDTNADPAGGPYFYKVTLFIQDQE